MQTYEIQEATAAEKLASIAEHLDVLAGEIDTLKAQISDLDEAGVCTGTDYWRDGTKLYANHGINKTCPIHGTPEPGKRLRTYVGTDATTQAEVLAAMERCKEKSNLESTVRQIEIQHSRIERAVTTAWRIATGHQRWEW